MNEVIQGPFAPNEHTGPASVDVGFEAQFTLLDTEGDEITVSWYDDHEIKLETNGYKYVLLGEDEIYSLLDFINASQAKYAKWRKSKKGKAWLKRNGL